MEPGSPLDKFSSNSVTNSVINTVKTRRKGDRKHRRRRPQALHLADGYAVTNNDVVNHASSVQVTTDNGMIYTAKVIGTDPKTDLALIKVNGKNDIPYMEFASHRPKVGDSVVAVGNLVGLGGTVTAGVVLAQGRHIGAGPYDDYVQIDAPIDKGGSAAQRPTSTAT